MSPPFSRNLFISAFYLPSFSPSILSPFIHFTSEAYRGYSGSFGDFGSIVFMVASQVSSSIVDRENSLHPILLVQQQFLVSILFQISVPPRVILPFHLFRPYSSIHSFFHIVFLSPFMPLLSRPKLSSIPLLFPLLYLLYSQLYIYHHLTLYLLSVSFVSPENPSQITIILFATSLNLSLLSSLYLLLSLLQPLFTSFNIYSLFSTSYLLYILNIIIIILIPKILIPFYSIPPTLYTFIPT